MPLFRYFDSLQFAEELATHGKLRLGTLKK
jgi:hypothetical protein